MLTWFAIAAFADPGNDPVIEPRLRIGPPMFVEHGVAFREGWDAAFTTDLGVQVVRSGPFTLDVGVPFTAPAALRVLGPWRNQWSIGTSVAGWLQVGPFFAFGPELQGLLRIAHQQGSAVGSVLIPTGGGRIRAELVRARSWSVGLTGRVSVDLIPTRLVLGETEILEQSRVVASLGVRFQTGTGLDRRDRRSR